jgi:uncharacterized protein
MMSVHFSAAKVYLRTTGGQRLLSLSLRSIAESLLAPVVPQIQVTLGCNFDCSYCFQDHCSNEIIDTETATLILAKCADYNSSLLRSGRGTVEVHWHGGEPLLAGLDFFREMLRVQASFPDVSFVNRLQTNGSLVTDEIAEFMVEQRFQVGFSLDGPQEINDRQRRTRGNFESAFAASWRGIQNFKRHVPDGRVPVIAVITRESTARAKELYAFFKELGAEVQLDLYDLRCSDLCAGSDQALFHHSPTQDEASDFLIELFDLWFHDPERRVDFKELRDELDCVLQPERRIPNPLHKKRCCPGRTIFDPRGVVFACDQYVTDADTAIGDIRRDSLATIMNRKAAEWDRVKRVIRQTPAKMGCETCEWRTSCMGGCVTCLKYNSMLLDARAKGLPDDQWPAASIAAPLREIAGETYYCDALRALRAHIRKEVQLELARDNGR